MLLVTSMPAVAAISASVNRHHIDLTDTLILSVQLDTPPGNDTPDFNPLNRDWRILATNQRSEISFRNGKIRATTIWQLTLAPQREGHLIIPALQWKNDTTASIAVRVAPITQSLQQQLDELLFFRTEVVQPKRVWVQSQIIYRIALYYSQDVQLGKNLIPPAPDNTRVQALGQAYSGREQLQGVVYWVVRQNYAIFPQISGQLRLAPELMTGYARLPGYGNQRKTITIQSSGHVINVLPKPPEYPIDKPWLPAQGIYITGDVAQKVTSATTGTAINLTLKLQAQGAAGSLLPHFPDLTLPKARIYKQPFELVEELNKEGVKSRMTLELAIIPTAPGILKIPPVRFSWWDTNNGRLREASWQGIEIKITGQPIVAAAAQPEIASHASPATTHTAQPSYSWHWLSLFLGSCWLLTLGYIWRLKNSTARATLDTSQTIKAEKEHQCFQNLVRACQQDDASAVKQALQAWASHGEVGGNRTAWHNLLHCDTEGQKLLDELNRHLYRSHESHFEASRLLKWVQSKRAERLASKTSGKPKLTAFYPDANTAKPQHSQSF